MAEHPPEDMAQVIPSLYCEDAGATIDFMEKPFRPWVESAFRNPDDGTVLQAKVRTGTGVIFVGPGIEAFGSRGGQEIERPFMGARRDIMSSRGATEGGSGPIGLQRSGRT